MLQKTKVNGKESETLVLRLPLKLKSCYSWQMRNALGKAERRHHFPKDHAIGNKFCHPEQWQLQSLWTDWAAWEYPSAKRNPWKWHLGKEAYFLCSISPIPVEPKAYGLCWRTYVSVLEVNYHFGLRCRGLQGLLPLADKPWARQPLGVFCY